MENRVSVIICLCVLLLSFFTTAEKCDASTISDSLQYLGNAFVKITTSEGKIIYIDPYAIVQPDSADIVLITHEHSDHNDLSCVRLKSTSQVIRAADALLDTVYQTFTIGSITIKAVPAYNQYHPKSQGVGFVIEFDGIKVYHAGGTGKIPEMADLASRNIDYALFPLTPGPELMTEAAALVQADHDIPIHTTVSAQRTYDTTLAARFTSPKKLIVRTDQTIELTNSETLINERNSLMPNYHLFQNFPNPFNPATVISYELPRTSHVILKVYDTRGGEVVTLVDEVKGAGNHSAVFNAAKLSSGVYFCKLAVGSYSATMKLLLVK